MDGTLEAVRHVLAGLNLAEQNARRYTFLVYNGSVHHWHAVQPLQRRGLRHHILPSMLAVMAALGKVPGHEEWKVRVLVFDQAVQLFFQCLLTKWSLHILAL